MSERRQQVVGCILVGLVLLFFAYREHRDITNARRLLVGGTEVIGRIESLAELAYDREYYITYSYQAGGRRFEGRAEIAEAEFRTLRKGEAIPVSYSARYHGDSVTVLEVAALERAANRLILVLVGSGLLLAAAWTTFTTDDWDDD